MANGTNGGTMDYRAVLAACAAALTVLGGGGYALAGTGSDVESRLQRVEVGQAAMLSLLCKQFPDDSICAQARAQGIIR